MIDVVAVCEPLATIDGVSLTVATVEYWRGQIVVRLAAELDAAALDLEAGYEARFEEWARRRTPGEWPPDSVVDPVARSLQLQVTDDEGAVLPFSGGSHGGDGTELALRQTFGVGASSALQVSLPGAGRTVAVRAPRTNDGRARLTHAPTSPSSTAATVRTSSARQDRLADRFIGVAAPGAAILNRDGQSIVVLSVEFWERQTVVHLTAEVDHDERAADEAYAQAMDAWAQSGRDAKREPRHALVELTRGLEVTTLDPDGRSRSGGGGVSGGFGSTWTSSYHLPGTGTDREVIIDVRSGDDHQASMISLAAATPGNAI